MKNQKIRALNKKLYFNVSNVQDALGIQRDSAKVRLSRDVKQGSALRLKKDIYVRPEKWDCLSRDEFFQLANILQVPSYVSFMTAMSYHEVTTQVQRNYFESAAVKRSRKFEAEGTVFCYYKLKKELYFGFYKMNTIFMAEKEKAFLDALYLSAMGRYAFDTASVDTAKFDKKKLFRMAKRFPLHVKAQAKKLCGI